MDTQKNAIERWTRLKQKKEVRQMWNIPSKKRLDRIPRLYETENFPFKDKLVHLHFFIGGCDWYACEFDGDDIFFGFAVLNDDLEMAEWGYFSFGELKSIKVNGWLEIDCELEEIWKATKACEVEKIRKAQFWPDPERDKDHDRQKSVYQKQGSDLPVL